MKILVEVEQGSRVTVCLPGTEVVVSGTTPPRSGASTNTWVVRATTVVQVFQAVAKIYEVVRPWFLRS